VSREGPSLRHFIAALFSSQYSTDIHPPSSQLAGRPVMLEGQAVAAGLRDAGVTHVIWIPDSELGTWNEALSSTEGLALVRVCRAGEAFAIAAGLWIGGKKPVVMIQCTGLFEAGDALRNVLHDLKIPLFVVVGVRSWRAHQEGKTADNCPVFTEPILNAWQIPTTLLPLDATAEDLIAEYRRHLDDGGPHAVLLPE